LTPAPAGAPSDPPLGLYLHVPYCTVRCSYCDFFLVPARGRGFEEYCGALAAEIEATPGALRARSVDTLHLGGGTPSLLPAPLLGALLDAARRVFRFAPEAEVGLEANPEDLEAARLAALCGEGVRRLTIGVQSLDDRSLKMLRRPHTARQALRSIELARKTPFRSLGADLILGLPGQDRATALAPIDTLLDLGLDHLSLYLLEIHPRTRLGREAELGRRAPMGDDEAAGLYEEAADRLEARGFEHYEISNFARRGHRSRHNVKYWSDQEYLGFGPSAHSYAGGRRWMNRADLSAYLAGRGLDPGVIEDPQPRAGRGSEALCAGLRMLEGVDLEALRARYGRVIPEVEAPVLTELGDLGLVTIAGPRLTLTRRGRLISNEVFLRLLERQGAEASDSVAGDAAPRSSRLS